MRSNAALFHTKYDNIQLNSQVGVSPTIVNAGDATIYGAEEELEWLIGQGLSLTGSAGYTHAAYDTLNDVTDNGYLLTKNSCPESSSNAPAPAVIPTGATLAQARALQQAVANSFQNGVCELPKTPKFKAYIGPQYIVNLPNTAQLQFNADVTYTTHEFNDIGNTWQLERPDMTMVNASLTYRTPSKQWDFVVGGTNISDRRYVVSGQNQGGLPVIDASYSPPREWYATFRFKPNLK
jgi:iron complex outermembrane receptor protein